MARPSTVTLRRNLARAIRAGHPWLYSDALVVTPGTRTGEVVSVLDRRGRVIGRGLFDAESPITVRIWSTRRNEPVDAALLAARVRSAAALRRATIDPQETTGYRLLHGEGDLVPGIVCDVYGSTAVLRYDTPSVEALEPALCSALLENLPELDRIVRKEGPRGEAVVRTLHGPPLESAIVIREHGVLFESEPRLGHKTGFYVDQRDNRLRVRALARGRRALNLFSYTGGFSVTAALGGAREVTSVDVSAPALEAARRNFALNGLDPADPRWRFEATDAFAFLEQSTDTYDLVVLDPPSMAPSAAALERGLAAYRRANELALARLAPDGLLVTASCSSHVTEQHLVDVLRDAAMGASRRVRIIERRGAGTDHPTLPAFPEGRYLNVLFAFVE